MLNTGTWCLLCMWLCLHESHLIHVGVVSVPGMHGCCTCNAPLTRLLSWSLQDEEDAKKGLYNW